ncbi:MAG: hypothetical protein H7Y09_04675 [Chitinophagaceae bacterium]|nr:hypothetical protein [Anaerolineae bacterium]
MAVADRSRIPLCLPTMSASLHEVKLVEKLFAAVLLTSDLRKCLAIKHMILTLKFIFWFFENVEFEKNVPPFFAVINN